MTVERALVRGWARTSSVAAVRSAAEEGLLGGELAEGEELMVGDGFVGGRKG